MITAQQPVEVEVFGQHFALRSEKSEEDVRQIAAYVDRQLQQVMAGQTRASLLRLALMAALTIADEYHTATGRLDMPHSV
jgi:cell division protein ZapA